MNRHLVLLLLFASCSDSVWVPSGAEELTVAEPGTVLETRTLDVCWHQPGQAWLRDWGPQPHETVTLSDETQEIMERTLRRELDRRLVGVDVGTFSDCPPLSETPLTTVRVARTRDGVRSHFASGIGNGRLVRRSDSEGKSVQIYVNNGPIQKGVLFSFDEACDEAWSAGFEACVSVVTLHEFGHLLGLRHEHGRVEARRDPNCSPLSHLFNEDGTFFVEPRTQTQTDFGLEYDPKSVMNYCYLEELKAKGLPADETVRFSDKDRLVLQMLYPSRGL